jgi:phosphopantothenoylcysteine decarboxylase/phosphopantothenate--cysteine ligase
MPKVVLGVTGGIAAYKAVYLLRLLRQAGYEVRVLMTESATRFVGPLTFEALSDHPVSRDNATGANPLSHIELAKWGDLFVVAPATANTIAKLAHGMADNLLTSVALAHTGKLAVFPAMNGNMYKNSATQANLEILRKRGIYVAMPSAGQLACGDEDIGKLPEPEEILKAIEHILSGEDDTRKPDYSGLRVLVTAGPTVEPIDAVRYISNYSSGRMGYAIAEEARSMGAEVTLISGPVSLPAPVEKLVKVRSAAEMLSAVYTRLVSHDILIMAAAVADYTVKTPADRKLKKMLDPLDIQLVPTDDILKVVSVQKRPSQVFVGFAAESDNITKNALKKISEKRLDIIVANDISRKDIGFDAPDNEVTLFFPDGSDIPVSKRPKKAVAQIILEQTLIEYKKKNK